MISVSRARAHQKAAQTTALARHGVPRWANRMATAKSKANPLRASDSERTDRFQSSIGVVVAKAKMTRNALHRLQPTGKMFPTVQPRKPQDTVEMKLCPIRKPPEEPVNFHKSGVNMGRPPNQNPPLQSGSEPIDS
jgi:hypothetical protein